MDILNRLRSLWERIQALPHQGPSHEDHSQETQQTPPPVIRSELYILEAVIERYEARQKEEDRRERWKRRVDIFTLASAIAGFFVLLATLCETRWAVNVAVDSYRWDKRAWMGIGNVQLLGELVAGQPMGVKVFLRNSGESPAVHVSSEATLSLLKSAGEPQKVPFMERPEFKLCVDPKPQWDEVEGGAVIIPGADAPSLSYLVI